MYIRNGKFGPYVEWGDKKESIKELDKSFHEIVLDDIIEYLSEKKTEKNVIRTYNDDLSLRRGKFGNYIYYKTKFMSKPEFFNIKKFPGCCVTGDVSTILDWVNKTYIQKK
jgi:hypothetical protein